MNCPGDSTAHPTASWRKAYEHQQHGTETHADTGGGDVSTECFLDCHGLYNNYYYNYYYYYYD